MAGGTDYPPPLSVVDGNYRKVNVTVTKDEKSEEILDTIKEPSLGKPPRHISSIGHSVSSAQLNHASELVSKPKDSAMPLFVTCLSTLLNHFFVRIVILGSLVPSHRRPMITRRLCLFFGREAVPRSDQSRTWRMSTYV